uniref:Tubulin beta-4 chain-like n=1 Tax=Crassostrea virginica TaxID=6565 RepID=A0A8B8E7P5_CRAVI|nr:tubulin beta-4 chain-like [Crassostrea virginica]
MREIIHVQVGQCGNQIGSKFWEEICYEHGLNSKGLYEGDNDVHWSGSMFFSPRPREGYTFRACLVDLEPAPWTLLEADPMAPSLDPTISFSDRMGPGTFGPRALYGGSGAGGGGDGCPETGGGELRLSTGVPADPLPRRGDGVGNGDPAPQ